MMRGKTVTSLSGTQLPIPGFGSVLHSGSILADGARSHPQALAVRGVVFDGMKLGFTEHDEGRGWDLPFSWREDDESPDDAFERAAYEALGCYVRPPEPFGSIHLQSSRPLGMPYGRATVELVVALFIAPFERLDLITEPGKNRTEWVPLSQFIEHPNFRPLQPWLLTVDQELRRRFSSLA